MAGDMSKKSDMAAPLDDQAPVPLSPFAVSQDVPAIDEDQQEDDAATQKEAAPYWHPAWETVEEKFREQLAVYKANNALVYKDLPADEFKIRMSSEAVVAEILEKVMEDVKRAVETVEQQPKRPKPARQPKSGA